MENSEKLVRLTAQEAQNAAALRAVDGGELRAMLVELAKRAREEPPSPS